MMATAEIGPYVVLLIIIISLVPVLLKQKSHERLISRASHNLISFVQKKLRSAQISVLTTPYRLTCFAGLS